MKLFELVIEDPNIDEVFAISLVEEPAIEANFVYFDKEEVRFQAVSDEQKLVMGPILVPDKKILRIDGMGEQYYVYFKPETIRRLAEMYLKKKYTDSTTIEHDKKVSGVSLVESWIVESRTKDKSAVYGLSLPVGTWMGTFKVDNEDIWNNYVKTGDVKGFSIEGLFGHNLVEQSMMFSADTILSDLEEQEAILILSEIRALIKKDSRYKGKKRVEMESFSDYGDGVANNAKRGIELNEKNGNKCATPVGKVRAQQLAQKRPISVETLKRMYSYLSRAEAYYDESDMNACGTISYLLWGGKSALSYSRNKLRELGLLNETEAQPSFPTPSTYPGEQAKGKKKYTKKQTLQADCPEATQNIEINLANRQTAIDKAMYGPLDIKNPGDYWKKIADKWGVDEQTARGEICGNCAAFNITSKMLECIAEGISGDDAWDVIEAGDLGYCEFFKFKCNANRSCSAHVDGGPITD